MWLSDLSKLPLRLGTPVPHSLESANLLPTAPLPLSFLSPPGQCHCIFQGLAQVLPHLKNLLHGHISSLLPSLCEVHQKYLGSSLRSTGASLVSPPLIYSLCGS